MIDLPKISADDILALADWVELSTSCEPSGSVSLYEVADILHSSGLAGTASGDNFKGEFSDEYDETLSDEECAERRAQDIWAELNRRSTTWKKGYPYTVEPETIRLTGDSWRQMPAYHMLLILDIVRSFPSGWIQPDLDTTRLFEKIVQAAKAQLLGGPTSRFGWPIEFGWPTSIADRVATLADELGLSVGQVDETLFPADNDRGLDVVGLVAIDEGSEGTLAILTQCAAGKNWRSKNGEPSIHDWQDTLNWKGTLVTALAVPWRLDEIWTYRRIQRKFNGAIVLDRSRLVALAPDSLLDPDIGARIVEWCEPHLSAFPRLG